MSHPARDPRAFRGIAGKANATVGRRRSVESFENIQEANS